MKRAQGWGAGAQPRFGGCRYPHLVIPAKAGTQLRNFNRHALSQPAASFTAAPIARMDIVVAKVALGPCFRRDDKVNVRAEIPRAQKAFSCLAEGVSTPGFQVKGAQAPLCGFTLELKARDERLAGMDCKAGSAF
jgi:hypothetical protein